MWCGWWFVFITWVRCYIDLPLKICTHELTQLPMVELKGNPAKQPNITQFLPYSSPKIAAALLNLVCVALAPEQINFVECKLILSPNFCRTLLKSPAQGLYIKFRCYMFPNMNCTNRHVFQPAEGMLEHVRLQEWMTAAHSLSFCVLQGHRWKIYFGAACRCAEWRGHLNGWGRECFGSEKTDF